MNHPDNSAIDYEEMRQWLLHYKEQSKLSWTQLAAKTSIPTGTLSPFATGNYNGNRDRISREVFKFKQMLETTAERAEGVPVEPGYFETPTSARLRALLVIAQMGRITVGATGPGTGKTMTMRQYQESVSNCWVATMSPTTSTLSAMMCEVLAAVGGVVRGGWNRQLSAQIKERIGGRRGLLVIDEANNLDLPALEEIRAWHDQTGVGICFLGNEELIMRIQGGPRRDAFARLNSRIAQSHIQNLPVPGDVEAFCDAWELTDPAMRSFLERVAMTPGAGGLRECRQIVESAGWLAMNDNRAISFSDLRDAQSTRATRVIRA